MTSRRLLVVEADAGQLLAAAKAAGIVPPTAELEDAAVSRTFDDPDEGPPQKVLLRFTDASFPEVPDCCAASTVKADVSLAETSRYVPPWGVSNGAKLVEPDPAPKDMDFLPADPPAAGDFPAVARPLPADHPARSAGRVGISPPPARPHFTPPTPRE